jgi:hypothetical protein
MEELIRRISDLESHVRQLEELVVGFRGDTSFVETGPGHQRRIETLEEELRKLKGEVSRKETQ